MCVCRLRFCCTVKTAHVYAPTYLAVLARAPRTLDAAATAAAAAAAAGVVAVIVVADAAAVVVGVAVGVVAQAALVVGMQTQKVHGRQR
jgi:uncharacterized protein (DUF885 family)